MTALLIVDVQNDFITGSLAVPDAARIVPLINRILPAYDLIVATQDWHPADHESFASNHPGRRPFETIGLHGITQTLWPVHCVQGTTGAAFAADLETDRLDAVVQKGTNRTVDSYSGFFDNRKAHATGLAPLLRKHDVRDVHICGLATDYCVKFTALDALALSFRTTLLVDACRGLTAHGTNAALDEMRRAGVILSSAPQATPHPVQS